MSRVLRVGITGGIGSGKTALTDRLAAFGIEIVDADRIAREVVEPGSAALAAIAAHFGADVIREDGSLDRAALRHIVFSSPAEREWLEALTHPVIGARIAERLATATSLYVVLASPLLLEGSQKALVDHIVVVDVPEAVQVERATLRDGNPESLVRAIMANQLPRQERLALADTVIDNSGDFATLDQAARALHGRLLALAVNRPQS